MSIKKARKLRDILNFSGIAIIFFGSVCEPLLYVGAIVALSGLIPHFLYNKCPSCHRQLGRNEGDFCQFCGSPLE